MISENDILNNQNSSYRCVEDKDLQRVENMRIELLNLIQRHTESGNAYEKFSNEELLLIEQLHLSQDQIGEYYEQNNIEKILSFRNFDDLLRVNSTHQCNTNI